MSKIDKESFHNWKQQPVTKAVMEALREIIDNLEDRMKSDSVITSDNGHKELIKLSGVREGVNYLLDIQIDDVDYDEEEENEL